MPSPRPWKKIRYLISHTLSLALSTQRDTKAFSGAGQPKVRYLSVGTPHVSTVIHTVGRMDYRGTSLIRKRPPPNNHHRALGIVLL